MVYPLAPRLNEVGKLMVPPMKLVTTPGGGTQAGPAVPCGVTPGPYVPLKVETLFMAVAGDPGGSFRIHKPEGRSPSTRLMKSAPAGGPLTVTEFVVIPGPRFTVVLPCTQWV